MKPITFECSQIVPWSAVDVCSAIADTARWSDFSGYGVLPGIASAEYEMRTDNMIGSRIRVRNTDGSAHVEEITRWVPGQAVSMTLQQFTPPLSHMATHFVEEWGFESEKDGTRVTRRFQLFPRRPVTRPILWLISLLFRRAVARHLVQMAAAR